jgi:hypothetical protein
MATHGSGAPLPEQFHRWPLAAAQFRIVMSAVICCATRLPMMPPIKTSDESAAVPECGVADERSQAVGEDLRQGPGYSCATTPATAHAAALCSDGNDEPP